MLGSNLKYLLKRFDVTQSQLALWLNVRQTTISNWINGIGSPSVEELVGIYHYFGISVQDLIFTNLSEGNLISDSNVAVFKQKGNRKGNPIGNLIAKNDLSLVMEQVPDYAPKVKEKATLDSIQRYVLQLAESVENMRVSLEKHGLKAG